MSRKSRRIVSVPTTTAEKIDKPKYHRWLISIGILTIISLITVGVLAERGIIGTKNTISTNSVALNSSGLNPAVLPPSPTPQLAKEYIYAGSRMLAVEDANAPHSSNQPSDLVVWRFSNGAWYVRERETPPAPMLSVAFGQAGDVPIPADFDGDGWYDFCVFRPNAPSAGLATWYIQPSAGGSFYGAQFGVSSDKPTPADFDGDGRSDVAVWRSSAASFYILKSSTNTLQISATGQTGDEPIPADYDGDGQADPAVYRLGSTITWIIKQSASSYAERNEGYGTTGDEPVRGDFNGDGKFDLAVRRNSANQWLYRTTPNGATTTISLSMQTTDKQVAGDYDGDGRTDAAVYRDGATPNAPSYWYIRKSSDGTLRTEQWGQHQDIPVPAPFRR